MLTVLNPVTGTEVVAVPIEVQVTNLITKLKEKQRYLAFYDERTPFNMWADPHKPDKIIEDIIKDLNKMVVSVSQS